MKWGNQHKLLTSQAEKVWEQPLYKGRQSSLLQTEMGFKDKVCSNLSDNKGCLFVS